MRTLRDLFMLIVCLGVLLWYATFGNTQKLRDEINDIDGDD